MSSKISEMKKILIYFLLMIANTLLFANEYHVSVKGNDSNIGSIAKPFKTINRAVQFAKAGDTITIHSGTYRERIKPLIGGISDKKRIVFRAAIGETVHIKGSEIINNWVKVNDDVWKVTIPNSFFGNYNPYKDSIYGDWFTSFGRIHHTGEVYLNGKSFYEVNSLVKVMNTSALGRAVDTVGSTYTWYCETNDSVTSIWANFHEYQPNKELVEINVRPTCFYPEKTGINYITISGFHFSQAATQWAPPTAEQSGLIGTNWSKGWIIENNIISDSKCSGISLGKDRATGQNVWLQDPGKDGSQHYNEVIFKALRAGWSKESVGSHIVRNNIIYNCEQTGICGSLGAVFSKIEHNHIYNIWVKRQFSGAEIAGIKIHAAIDVVISNNRINNTCRAIWLDWMAQGTVVNSNLFYNNFDEDLFVEVNHGPFLVCNNIMLSPMVLLNQSEGGAYVHNLITGRIYTWPEPNRFTPYLFPHSTFVSGIMTILKGDDRYYNNIFCSDSSADENIVGKKALWTKRNKSFSFGLSNYEDAKLPVFIASNIYLNSYKSYSKEINCYQNATFNPSIKLEEKGDEVFLYFTADDSFKKIKTQLIKTEFLGKTKMSGAAFENPDGSALKINTDYFGKKRSMSSPLVGPFEYLPEGEHRIKVW